MLKIENFSLYRDGKKILDDINFCCNHGEIHCIMGPNGSGKSSLACAIVGKDFDKIEGKIDFLNENLLEMKPEVRACKGIFLSFQNPVEIPGVSNTSFLKESMNQIRKFNGLDKISANDFFEKLNKFKEILKISDEKMKRGVNEGFSGGEKKKNELLQMMMIDPKLSILDEIDSGVDVDSMKIIFQAINSFKNKKKSIIFITHYPKIFEYINVDFLHILCDGKILKSGKIDLVEKIEKYGYKYFTKKD